MVKRYKLALPVEMSFLQTKNAQLRVPVFKLSSWADFMMQNNCWHVLTGLRRPDEKRSQDILDAFWKQYRLEHPSHQIFQLARDGAIDLRRTIPTVLHGDEGRGRKHSAYRVISFHSLIGRGLQPSEKLKSVRPRVRKPYLKLRTNYIGHSYTTRFMLCGIRKQEYTGDHAHVFDSLMQFCASEVQGMYTSGIKDSKGQSHWMAMLHMTGDWPWLCKSGNLARSFHTAPKTKRQKVFPGLCHICRAGQPGVPFEQIETKRPLWLSTEYQQEPSDEASPFREIPHVEGEFGSLWAFDFFHSWHLGVAKYVIGGALALLSMHEEGTKIELRFEALTKRYKEWCQATGRRAHIQNLTKEKIAWSSSTCFPCGTSHKGELSTVLMAFLEATLSERNLSHDPLLNLVQDAVISINRCVKEMYRADLWLSPEQSRTISNYGCKFLRRYGELAHQSRISNKNLFMYPPKVHIIQKIMLHVHRAAEQSRPHLNPIALSVQQDEDFISRPARLCRRVSGFAVASERVASRYLQACYSQWILAGLLVRPVWFICWI